jgi:leader peptidase (prepilin peptidase)/N-methyltransferase
MLSDSILSLLTVLWPSLLMLSGLGLGLELNALADQVQREHPGSPDVPQRAVRLMLTTALLFGLAGWRFGLTWRATLNCAYIAILILVTATDLEHRIIPHRLILPAILLALAAGFFVNWMTWKAVLVGGAVGLVFFSAAYGVSAMLYPGKIALGLGDVTLSTFIGLAVGFPSALVAVMLGVLMGGLFSALLLVTRRVTLQTAIPYGPFLVLGGLVAMFWGQAITHWWLGV